MMLKIGCIGVAAVLLALMLKKEKNEFAILISIVAGMVIFAYALAQLQTVIEFLTQLIGRLPIESTYLFLLLKMLGIMYVADFASSICRESGYSSIAGQMELFAKLSIVVLSIPELMYLVNVLENFL